MKVTNEEAVSRIREFQPFETRTGNLRGIEGPRDSLGDLPPEEWASARTARYTVLSYGTPIGWVDAAGMLVVPEYRHSLTTTEHQRLLLAAWKLFEKRPFEWPLLGEGASTGPRRGGW